jgi:hypothetical protein
MVREKRAVRPVHEREEWGTVMSSNFPIDDADWAELKAHVADAMAELERWDLRVGKVTISARRDNPGGVYIKARPEKGFRAPVGVVKTVVVRRCQECGVMWPSGKVHRDNGCNTGIVDEIMST